MSSPKPGVQTETKVEVHETMGVMFLGIIALLLTLTLMRTLRHNRELVGQLQESQA